MPWSEKSSARLKCSSPPPPRYNTRFLWVALPLLGCAAVSALSVLSHAAGKPSSPGVQSAATDPDPNFLLDSNATPGSFVVSFDDGRPDTDAPTSPSNPSSASSSAQVPVDEYDGVFTSVSDEDWTNPDDPVTNPQGVTTAQSLVSTYGGNLRYVGDEVGAFAVDDLSETQA